MAALRNTLFTLVLVLPVLGGGLPWVVIWHIKQFMWLKKEKRRRALKWKKVYILHGCVPDLVWGEEEFWWGVRASFSHIKNVKKQKIAHMVKSPAQVKITNRWIMRNQLPEFYFHLSLSQGNCKRLGHKLQILNKMLVVLLGMQPITQSSAWIGMQPVPH